MNAPFQSIAGSGASPVGEPKSPAGSRSPLRLVRATAASWTHERKQEAREAGYHVVFDVMADTLIASFWNGPFHCFDREWTP